MARNPDNPPSGINNYGRNPALEPIDFRVDEEVLQRLAASEPQRTKHVTGSPVSNQEGCRETARFDNGLVASPRQAPDLSR
jgi:hypothetical protein